MDNAPQVTRLAWTDPSLGTLDLPARPMAIRTGFGSGLSLRAGDPPGTVWAVCDRGPNIKVKSAVKHFRLTHLAGLAAEEGAKVMPRLDLGPAVAELRVGEGGVELVRSLPLRLSSGEPLSGLPIPGGPHARSEPAYDLDGRRLAPAASGADTEGLAALAEGGFWIADEYGPSLLRVDEEG